MAQSQFSLSWETHQKHICNGLSNLQQNGEFVDMTLAADGYMVKVHQVIMALASPYIKELISSAQCPHPIVFLNKVSYSTLCEILEYIYTGEVVVPIENLNELVQASKELHIKGLEDMKIHQAFPSTSLHGDSQPATPPARMDEEVLDDDFCYFEIASLKDGDNKISLDDATKLPDMVTELEQRPLDDAMQEDNDPQTSENGPKAQRIQHKFYSNKSKGNNASTSSLDVGVIQYTISNQGSLQMILNRFLYYLKHMNRDGSRQWRCIDYLAGSRCPALVVTKDDAVQQRSSSHTHAFHDIRILKKVRDGAVFSALHQAEAESESKKTSKVKNNTQKEQE